VVTKGGKTNGVSLFFRRVFCEKAGGGKVCAVATNRGIEDQKKKMLVARAAKKRPGYDENQVPKRAVIMVCGGAP